jgi:hypothetical protein
MHSVGDAVARHPLQLCHGRLEIDRMVRSVLTRSCCVKLKAKAPRVWDPRAKGAEIRSVDLRNVDSLPQLIFNSADHYGTERTLKASRAGQRVWARHSRINGRVAIVTGAAVEAWHWLCYGACAMRRGRTGYQARGHRGARPGVRTAHSLDQLVSTD